MKLLFFLLASILFVILSPGVVFKILKKSSKTTQMVVHTLIFAFSLIVLSKLMYYFFGEKVEEQFGLVDKVCDEASNLTNTKFVNSLSNDASGNDMIGTDINKTKMRNIIVGTLQKFAQLSCAKPPVMPPEGFDDTIKAIDTLRSYIQTSAKSVTVPNPNDAIKENTKSFANDLKISHNNPILGQVYREQMNDRITDDDKAKSAGASPAVGTQVGAGAPPAVGKQVGAGAPPAVGKQVGAGAPPAVGKQLVKQIPKK